MILTCPGCDNVNELDLNSDDLYQCYYCDHQFSQIDSIDRDWDKLHEGFKRDISPEVCLDWRTKQNIYNRDSILNVRSLEKEFGRYGLESAFYQHFGIRHNEVNKDILNQLKIQLERDNKINKLGI